MGAIGLLVLVVGAACVPEPKELDLNLPVMGTPANVDALPTVTTSILMPIVAFPTATVDETQAAELPRFTEVVVNETVFQVEVASSESALRRGLMGRESLERNEGMLFVFGAEDTLTFWMKDVAIPLDVLFITTEGTITDIHTMSPEPATPDSLLTRYASSRPARYALELNAGTAEEYGFQPGQMVDIR